MAIEQSTNTITEPGMVIIGGGQAGGRAALSLREHGWVGTIHLVCEEPYIPYERPILSKRYLLEEISTNEFVVSPEEELNTQGISIHLGVSATHINRNNQSILLSNGKTLHYQKTLIATGRKARIFSCPGLNTEDVYNLRTIDDAKRIKQALKPSARLIIVGAGFIGLEIAAVARSLDCTVHVIGRMRHALTRGCPLKVARYLQDRHRAEGVQFHFKQSVISANKTVSGFDILLKNDIHIEGDMIVAGIGADPNCELAENAGLKINDGIVVDNTLHTSDPNILAAGDVIAMRNDHTTELLRFQNWESAELQGRLAAKNMLGENEKYLSTPWIWSDQYDLSLQMLGETDKTLTLIERPLDPGLMVYFLNEQKHLVGVCAVGSSRIGRTISICRKLIAKQSPLSIEALADPKVDLKQLLKSIT